MESIVSGVVQVCIHEDVSILSKKTVAENLETIFHLVSMRTAKITPEESKEEGPQYFSISRAFAEFILNNLQESKGNKNRSIGAILVVQSYLKALGHQQRLFELKKVFLLNLISINNDVLTDTLTKLHEFEDEHFVDDSEEMQFLVGSYEVLGTYIQCIYSLARECVLHNGQGLELFAVDTGLANLLFQIIGVVGTNSKQCQQVFLSKLFTAFLQIQLNLRTRHNGSDQVGRDHQQHEGAGSADTQPDHAVLSETHH